MTLRNVARLAIHRRADEMAFLQHRLRTLQAEPDRLNVRPNLRRKRAQASSQAHNTALETAQDQRDTLPEEHDLLVKVFERERDLADELVHTRQTEPLGETLQRRLAMAEHICRDLLWPGVDSQDHLPNAYWVAEIERQALAEMLKQWWAWLHRP